MPRVCSCRLGLFRWIWFSLLTYSQCHFFHVVKYRLGVSCFSVGYLEVVESENLVAECSLHHVQVYMDFFGAMPGGIEAKRRC